MTLLSSCSCHRIAVDKIKNSSTPCAEPLFQPVSLTMTFRPRQIYLPPFSSEVLILTVNVENTKYFTFKLNSLQFETIRNLFSHYDWNFEECIIGEKKTFDTMTLDYQQSGTEQQTAKNTLPSTSNAHQSSGNGNDDNDDNDNDGSDDSGGESDDNNDSQGGCRFFFYHLV